MRRNNHHKQYTNYNKPYKKKGYHSRPQRQGQSQDREETSKEKAFLYFPSTGKYAVSKGKEYTIPKENELFFKDHIKNYALLFEKYPLIVLEKGESKPKLYGREMRIIYDTFGLNRETASFSFTRVEDEFIRLYHSFLQRYEKAFMLLSQHTIKITLTADTPIAIHLGSNTLYETGFRFHKPYGIPYIPGSAVKGVLRTTAILLTSQEKTLPLSPRKLDNSLQKGELNDIPPEEPLFTLGNVPYTFEDLHMIFGSQKQKGAFVFSDLLPLIEKREDTPILRLDIMNPHYKDYYTKGGEFPPLDENPTPIFFLTIAPSTRFTLYLAPNTQKIPQHKLEDYSQKIRLLMKEAFTYLGIGAKGTSGYGRLSRVEPS